MTQIAARSEPVERAEPSAPAGASRLDWLLWQRLALGLAAVGAGVLDFWNLASNGWGNQYYAAAVRSMLQNWEAFRYACFDPACFVTVDKPPLAFWIETVSARLFGFSSLGLLGPSALAGALSVLVLGHTVGRLFGMWAGLIAAVVLALTPVTVITSRSNNPDALLVLLVVLAAWAGARAMQSGRWHWVALTTLLLGLGFLTKTLAAFLVLPAFVVAYLVCAPATFRVRLAQVLAGAAILAAICFGWMLSVDLTPAAARPWVGGSGDNSELSLAFGSNGILRVFGLGALGGGDAGGDLYVSSGGTAVAITPGASNPVSIGAAAGAAFGGPAGADRLLTSLIAAQGSWLLPLAAVGFLSALIAIRRPRGHRWLAGLLVFGVWTGVVWAVFSFAAGIFHPYYVAELAPAIAALVGVGVVALAEDVRAGHMRAVLAAAALAGTGLFEWSILASTSSLGDWRWALLAISLFTAAAVALVPLLVARRHHPTWWSGMGRGAFGLGLAALLVAPAAWATSVPASAANGQIPMAQGPRTTTARGGSGFSEGVDASRLLEFLESNAGQQQYLLATDSPPIGGIVDTLMAQSGRPIIPLSGFGVRGGPVSQQQLAAWVYGDQVRYFLLGGGPGRMSALTADVRSICSPVPAGDWGGSEEPVLGGPPSQLYDCAGKGGQLVAAANASGTGKPVLRR